MHCRSLGKEDRYFRPERRHERGVAELSDQRYGSVRRPREKVEDQDGHGNLGDLDLHPFLFLVRADLGVHLFRRFLHLYLVVLDRAENKAVATEEDAERDSEAKNIHEEYVRPVIIASGQIIKCTRRPESLRNVTTPTENWRQARGERPEPDDDDHEECFLARHGFSHVDGTRDGHVAVDGDHHHGVYGHQPKHAAYQPVKLTGCKNQTRCHFRYEHTC